MIETVKIEARGATGGAGVATKTGTTNGIIEGRILNVAVEYLDSPPGTTDVTIRTVGDRGPSRDIMVVANAATDFSKQPMVQASNPANGNALAYTTTVHEVYVPMVVSDRIEAIIAQADDGDGIDVWVTYER